MMKKIFYALFLSVVVAATLITAGCSKSEQAMASVSVVSAAGAGASVLKGHFKRNRSRKRKISMVRFGTTYTKLG
jgi:hypothetical protein